MTSGIKAQASVFNVRGCPCLCVEASGSMKGGRRGHFRHLLLPCTTHLSICVRCCPSVHSHTYASTKTHTFTLRVKARALQDIVFLFCAAKAPPLLWPVFLAGERCQALLREGSAVSANHNGGNWRKPEKEGPL